MLKFYGESGGFAILFTMEHSLGNTGLTGLDWLLIGLFLVLAFWFLGPGLWHKWRHQQTRQRWAIQAHSVEIEAQDGGGYNLIE